MVDSPANDLIRRILETTGVTYYEICSQSRKRNIVQSRAIFCHEMRFTQKYLCREIAYCIGITHTSVSYLSTKFNIDQYLLKKVKRKNNEA